MSGNRSKKKASQKALNVPATAPPTSKNPAETVATNKPSSAPIAPSSGDCHVQLAVSSTTEASAAQQKPQSNGSAHINGTVASEPSAPTAAATTLATTTQSGISAADSKESPATNGFTVTEAKPQPVSNGTASTAAVSTSPAAQTSPHAATMGISPAAAGVAKSAAPAPVDVTPAVKASMPVAVCTAVISKLAYCFTLAVHIYTKPMYYSAGAAMGVVSAVRSELGWAKPSK